jgi:hypothetical protein
MGELEFNRYSTAVKQIFSKVEQIPAGLASSSTEGFSLFVVESHTHTRSAIEVERLKNRGQTSSSNPRFDFPRTFFAENEPKKSPGKVQIRKSNISKPRKSRLTATAVRHQVLGVRTST